MEAWILITIAAAAAQTVRFMLQKHLKSTRLSTAGATFSRFLYSAPLIAILLFLYIKSTSQSFPETSPIFWRHALTGGVAQILATMCVVELFAARNFAVGMTFKKTEALLTVFVGYILLGEGISAYGIVAILVGFVGVIVLSDPPGERTGSFLNRITNKAAGLGILSGLLFAISAVSYRGATLALPTDDIILRAGSTLAVVVTMQTLLMLAWLAWRDREQISAVLKAWRVAGLVGITSMLGSFGWFTAFTLQNAAYVKTLGQVELVFSLAASVLFFKEKISRRELFGIGLLLLSILLLVALI